MPDQFIVVNFPEARTVFSGGKRVGPTNQYLVINAGTHTFTLSDPQDYIPPSQQIEVNGTSIVDPMPITFAQIPPAAIPERPS